MGDAWFGLFVTLFGGVWLYAVARDVLRDLKENRYRRWMNSCVAAMGLLAIVGGAGFFAIGLSAAGFLTLPNSFEWPAGYVCGIEKTPDGKYIVPLVPPGRLQIYDQDWRFVRGWHIAAHGGDFQASYSKAGLVDVYTGRQNHHYSFAENGELVSATTFTEGLSPVQDAGECKVVPTPVFGWPLSSPLISWSLIGIGGVGLAIVRRVARNTAKQSS